MTQDELAFLGSAPQEVIDFIDTHKNVKVLDPANWHELQRFNFGASFINGDGDANSEWSAAQVGSTTYLVLVHTKDGQYLESLVVATPIVDGKETRSGGFSVARGKVQTNLHASGLPNVMMEIPIPGWQFETAPNPNPNPSGDCLTLAQLNSALQPILNNLGSLATAINNVPHAIAVGISTPHAELNTAVNNNVYNAAERALIQNHIVKVADLIAGGSDAIYSQEMNENYLATWDILFDRGITTAVPPNRTAPGVPN